MIKFQIPHRQLPAQQFIDWTNKFTQDDSKRCRILLAELLLQVEGQWHNYWMCHSRPLSRPAKSVAAVRSAHHFEMPTLSKMVDLSKLGARNFASPGQSQNGAQGGSKAAK